MPDNDLVKELFKFYQKGECIDAVIETAAENGYIFFSDRYVKAKCASFKIDALLFPRGWKKYEILDLVYKTGQSIIPSWFEYDAAKDTFNFSEDTLVSAFINHYSIEKKNGKFFMNGEAVSDDTVKNALLQSLSIVRAAPGSRIYSVFNALSIKAAQQAPQQDQEAEQKTPEQLFDNFFSDVQTEKFKPLQTGMSEFDSLLGGGILRQSLVILSAAPGTGKTSIAQQIFEVMAAHGTEVIFLNLEMSREQLLARSISRIIHKQGHNMTAAEVLKGYAWSDYQRQYVAAAAQEYRCTIAPRMQYNPEGCTTNIENIRDTLTRAGEQAKAAGKPAPVCVLDYLHLITTEKREEQAEILKKAVAMLKNYARQYDTFVLAISANNRNSNSSGIVSLDSGRDTSAIEYSADYQLALNYKAFTEKLQKLNGTPYKANDPDDLQELQEQSPRQMTLQVLKNRMNAAGGKIFLDFDSANSAFAYAGKPEKRVKSPQIPKGYTLIEDDPDNPSL